MERFNMILLFLAVVRCSYSLECYDHYWSEDTSENNMWNTMTCDPGITSCTATLSIESGKTSKSYGCSYHSTCHEVAHATSVSTLIQTCCYDDLCNNQTKDFEDDEEYCYSAQCDYEGCLPGLIETMHDNGIGAYCEANDNGCQLMKRKDLAPDGNWKIIEFIACSDPYPCVGGTTQTDSLHMDRQCCKGHLCTDGNNTAVGDEDQDSCYEYYCLSSKKGHCMPPTDLSESVRRGQATLCPRTSKGCYYYEAYGINKLHYEFATGCFTEGIMNMDECVPMITKWDDVTAKVQCCHSDRCNSFIAQHNSTKQNQCLSMSCAGENCLTTTKQAGSYWLCDKNENGCQIGVLNTGLESVYTVGCATTACEKGSVTSEGLSVLECCTGDRCLPQALTGDGFNGVTHVKIALSWILTVLLAIMVL